MQIDRDTRMLLRPNAPNASNMEIEEMQTKLMLTVADVNTVLDAARAEAERNGWAVSIAVVDDGGHPLGLTRLDGATAVSAYIAIEKARTSALGRRESKGYEDMINGGRSAFLSAPLTAMLEGGVPIVVNGQCIGAVGVSNVQSHQDAQIARAGASSLTN
jgi:glc operon protein GlcG